MTEKKRKIRLDKLLMDRQLASTRRKAQALIMAGCVLVGEVLAAKQGQLVSPDAKVRIRGPDHPYVGRGGIKLAHALKEFRVRVCDGICMDVGASTGGFTDCLLQNGASKVYAIDVGYGQLAMKLATDERVIVIERTNVRELDLKLVPDPIDIAVIDVSFISLSIVLPAVEKFLSPDALVIALVKPQFEVGKGLVGRGGIVRDSDLHEKCIEKVRGVGMSLGLKFEGVTESPIRGAKGNREFLICFSRGRCDCRV